MDYIFNVLKLFIKSYVETYIKGLLNVRSILIFVGIILFVLIVNLIINDMLDK